MGLLGIACLALLVVPPPLGASVAGPGSSATADGFGGGAASPDDEATRAAHDILAAGGNSTDAALGAAAVLAVRIPQSAGLGGGSAVVHVDGASGAVDLVDGCRPLEATAAWVTAKARWGSDATDVYGEAAQHAHGTLRASVRALSLGDSLDLRSGSLDGSTAGRLVQRRLLPQDVDGRMVAGGAASAQEGSVPADAYASVVVADRNGDVTAVVTSMGRRGGSGRAVPGTGVTGGAPLPSACGETLPTVLLQRSPDGRTLSAALAVAPSGSRKAVAESSDPRRSVSAVLGRYGGPPLSAMVSRQRVPLVAVALDQDGSVHAVGLGRTGGSAAVVHDA